MAATELEGVILGIISSRQPCSAWAVRRRFEESPTWGWSKSKGAIYPAIARLKTRGCLTAERVVEGHRDRDLLSLTDTGSRELTEWISTFGEEMGGAPVDPIRTRVNYLAVLPLNQRRAFLDRAEAAARDALVKATMALPDPRAANRWTLHATALGILMQIKAKIEWLEAVRQLAATFEESGDWHSNER